MIYNQFKDKQLSALGMGCMRLPTLEDGKIDVATTRQMVQFAFDSGINYFDTAWGYHDGQSELVMGEVLKDYPRDKFYLASKFPGFNLENMKNVKGIFNKQLEKCQVDHFDFYLFHCLTESNVDGYLNPEFGIFDYLMEQKRLGRIGHLGFSAHATMDTLKRFLDAYGKDLEFCQLQINWLDWDYQDAKQKVDLVTSYGLPVWVMEPVRGGSLVNLKDRYLQRLKALDATVTPAQWGFRFIQSLPQVKMTLSGMSNMAQLEDNVKTYQQSNPLTEEQMQVLFDIGKEMTGRKILPCTSCRYCMANCPMQLDIPWLISQYNDHLYGGGDVIDQAVLKDLPQDKWPSACVGCRACEQACPQNIEISQMMQHFTKKVK